MSGTMITININKLNQFAKHIPEMLYVNPNKNVWIKTDIAKALEILFQSKPNTDSNDIVISIDPFSLDINNLYKAYFVLMGNGIITFKDIEIAISIERKYEAFKNEKLDENGLPY